MLGWPEIVIIGGVLFVFFGPKRLPEFARSVGEAAREFKKVTEEGSKGLTTPPPPTQLPISLCPSCGSQLSDLSAVFCSKCGKPLGPTLPPSSNP